MQTTKSMEATMQIYWSLNSIPELAGLASAERRRVWRTDCWKAYRHPGVADLCANRLHGHASTMKLKEEIYRKYFLLKRRQKHHGFENVMHLDDRLRPEFDGMGTAGKQRSRRLDTSNRLPSEPQSKEPTNDWAFVAPPTHESEALLVDRRFGVDVRGGIRAP